MKRKIVALIAVIPLILLFTVFSVSGAVSLAISVPVSFISIENKNGGIITLDRTSYHDGDFKLSVRVYPLNAANKGFTKSMELIDECDFAPSDVLSISDEGCVSLNNKIGRVKVTFKSNDGGYTDSVIIIATSSTVMSLYANSLSLEGETPIDTIVSGEKFLMEAQTYPETAYDSEVIWSSSDENIVSVNRVTGIASAITSGEATITAQCGALTSSKKVTVDSRETASNITVNGNDEHNINIFENNTSLSFLLEAPKDTVLSFSSSDSFIDVNELLSEKILPSNGSDKHLVTIPLLGENAPDSLTLTISGGTQPYVLTLNFVDSVTFTVYNLKGEVENGSTFYMELLKRKNFAISSSPAVENLTYEWKLKNGNAVSLEKDALGELCKFTASGEPSQSDITVTAYLDGEKFGGEFTFSVSVKQTYTSLILRERAKTFGIGKTLTVGNMKIKSNSSSSQNAQYENFDYPLNLTALNNLTEYSQNAIDKDVISWSTSDPDVAYVQKTESGYFLKIVSSGKVTLSASWTEGIYFNKTVEEKLTLYVVYGGVNVYNANDFSDAANDGHPVILHSNVMLGKNLSGYSTGAAIAELKSQVKKMPTTADDSFYIETQGIHPTVNYIVEFKNNVFGNGYFVNANNITNYNDGSARLSDAVFNGPLDIVSLSGIASVKAQDNIVFLVKNDNITIDNIELVGMNDVQDLTELNKAGTVLEVVGSGVKVLNSRIKNGRTVLRFFGKSYDSEKTLDELKATPKDTLRIESSMLSCAREFLLKIGTNTAVKNNPKGYDFSDSGSENNFSDFAPKLFAQNGVAFAPRYDQNKDNEEFASSYLKSEVTLKNSTLATSGLFSIGIESKFSGPLLFGFKIAGITLDGWSKMAGTSFASLLKLEGDVRIYDWKNLENIDSSSLIEVEKTIAENYAALSMFNLDLGKMVLDVSNQNEQYSSLIFESGGKKFAHGGIAFFGGGYNYSAIDTDNFNGVSLTEVEISMDLNETLSSLKLAAGNEPFRFFMYGNDTPFNLVKQLSDLETGSAYSWIESAENNFY